MFWHQAKGTAVSGIPPIVTQHVIISLMVILHHMMHTFYEYVTTIILHLKQDNVTRLIRPRSTAVMHPPVSL